LTQPPLALLLQSILRVGGGSALVVIKIHVRRHYAWRLACSGIIPATKKTKGGHFYFVKCRQLTRWINFMQGSGAFRKNELSQSYQRGYGKETPAFKKMRKGALALVQTSPKTISQNSAGI
jgi:hypothetical protein